jgi:hypothetical protein
VVDVPAEALDGVDLELVEVGLQEPLRRQILGTDGEAYQGPCTAKSTLYCANVAAGFMVAQLTKLFRDIPYDKDVQVNILANEMRFEDVQRKAAAEDQSSAS